jgi:hypothetical protein
MWMNSIVKTVSLVLISSYIYMYLYLVLISSYIYLCIYILYVGTVWRSLYLPKEQKILSSNPTKGTRWQEFIYTL